MTISNQKESSNNNHDNNSHVFTEETIEIKDMVPIEQVWKMRHIVMYPYEEFDFIKIVGDDTALHYGVYLKVNNNNDYDVVMKEGGEKSIDQLQPQSLLLVSVISLFVTGDEVQFRKFATLEQYQSRGYGTKLLKYVINMIVEMKGIRKLWCSAREAKSSFYTKFGLIQVGDRYIKNNIPMVRMEMIINNQ